MARKLLALILVVAIIHMYAFSPALMARSLPEKIQQQVELAGIGSYVESKLTDGETLTGRLEATEEKFFTLGLFQAESPQVQVNYDQVSQLEIIKKPSYSCHGQAGCCACETGRRGLAGWHSHHGQGA